MNHFLMEPKLKPEFKMRQPLPAFPAVPVIKREPAGAPEAVALGLSRREQPEFPAVAKLKPFTTADRSMTS